MKMCVLLYIPGLLVVLFKRRGLVSTAVHMLALGATQVLIGLPFLLEHPRSYLKYSYEFSRVFLFKWTVNWRFLGEDLFLSPAWAKGLLVGHVTTLALFGLFKWCRSDGGVWSVLERGLRQPLRAPSAAPLAADRELNVQKPRHHDAHSVTVLPADVATILYTSNLIGILFARSLHYQFYSWYAMQLPFLTWRTKYPVVFRYVGRFGRACRLP